MSDNVKVVYIGPNVSTEDNCKYWENYIKTTTDNPGELPEADRFGRGQASEWNVTERVSDLGRIWIELCSFTCLRNQTTKFGATTEAGNQRKISSKSKNCRKETQIVSINSVQISD